MRFLSSTNPNQRYLTVNFDSTTPTDPDEREVNNTSWKVKEGKKVIEVRKSVNMYDHYWETDKEDGILLHSEYTEEEFMRSSAHEFGHVLGLGDAYKTNLHPEALATEEVPSIGWYQGDIMRNNGAVNSNSIEMILEAWILNRPQGFVDGDPYYDKSGVIRWKG